MKRFSKNLVIFGLILGSHCAIWADTTPPAPQSQTMQSAIAAMQKQLQSVSDSIPMQLQKLQAANQQQMDQLRLQIDDQLKQLHQQVQQVQDNLTTQINTLQKQVNELRTAPK